MGQAGNPKKVALTACMRKLLTILSHGPGPPPLDRGQLLTLKPLDTKDSS